MINEQSARVVELKQEIYGFSNGETKNINI